MRFMPRFSRLWRPEWLALCLILCLAAWPAPARAAAETALQHVQIRVIAAGNSGPQEKNAGLTDVLPFLKETLRYSSYQLLSTRTVTPAENLRVSLDSGLTLAFRELRGRSCTVNLERRGQLVVTTRVNLLPGQPIIVGPVPEPGGTVLLTVLNGE